MITEQLYQIFLQHPQVSTDTRKIAPDSIFFALKGANFNANTFAAQALETGAAYAVIDEAAYCISDRFILVDDVLTALQDLARYYRKQLNIPVIGLTGSNGKTTTKELINSVLSRKFKTYATKGNLNNHIGVPLTLLAISRGTEIAIIEMGANHQQEIAFLCNIAQPTHGLITNIGRAHLEGFGGPEGVKKGKGELFDFLEQSAGTVFVNHDDLILEEMAFHRHFKQVVYYGKDETNVVSGEILENVPLLKIQWQANKANQAPKNEVQTQLTGSYNFDNILAAICIGHHFKLSAEQINSGISRYQPENSRSQIVQTKTNTLICDYYNANPSSMEVAIKNMEAITANKKVLILGDMFELGEHSSAEHELIIKKANEIEADQRIFIGKGFYEHHASFTDTFFETTDAAFMALKTAPVTGATVLVKGSRGMHLETLLELL
ncbi:UDP-N-acetylmuramoyl-tripeptide--D-alanyl-D-alanine ligase [Mucilaginibacter arboris]|uniref:UDP-N-acetylmuramoyl-tripeptide--D-alanyl-D-alanine ligase n=1 Tax=Mucilaginibacter arboris TaxID=2682090 RepID=A0A7K1SSK5_9SPHI|nr:UDP-N-acetylmuramoyl-tripeptide--D-alanyl-D-alanine ligase [Mucilaginibacter arboris]MVN20224.1 UDP-N-acetylmuramoyl-tripeptide--D-alanyl-D-alanine ligase [Mucilaginibacter arboris]